MLKRRVPASTAPPGTLMLSAWITASTCVGDRCNSASRLRSSSTRNSRLGYAQVSDFLMPGTRSNASFRSSAKSSSVRYDKWSETRARSEEHTSELQSLMRISYAVFCLKKKNKNSNDKKHSTRKRNTDDRHTTICTTL